MVYYILKGQSSYNKNLESRINIYHESILFYSLIIVNEESLITVVAELGT